MSIGKRARAALLGRIEMLDQGEWQGDRLEWRVELRRVLSQWKLAIVAAENLDYVD